MFRQMFSVAVTRISVLVSEFFAWYPKSVTQIEIFFSVHHITLFKIFDIFVDIFEHIFSPYRKASAVT